VSEIQPIIHKGQLAAVVADGRAIIRESVPEREQPTVKAMCLYALEIAEGRLPGPYSAAEALVYARAAAANRN
jgi:hypothetical protein